MAIHQPDMDGVGGKVLQNVKTITILRVLITLSPSDVFFLNSIVRLLKKKRKKHIAFSLFPSGSFPQKILDLVPMQLVVCLKKWASSQGDVAPERRKGRKAIWNPIMQRPGLFYRHKQYWPISCMATESKNCSYTNSIAVKGLAQGMDINSIFI